MDAMRLLLLLAACTPRGVVVPLDSGDSIPGIEDSQPGDDDTGPSDTEAIEDRMAIVFSVERGIYEDGFELELSTLESGTTIHWTTDGSHPDGSARASEADSPTTLTVDPYSEDGRDPVPGFVVRAYASKEGRSDGRTDTSTYLFTHDVTALSPDNQAPGPDWPEPYQTDNYQDSQQAIDYGMDPDVYEDPDYAELMVPALEAIPSLSLVTDLENLFDEDEGIYVNPMGHGEEWERPVSAELLDPSGGEQFQVDAGLRIRGGWSRWAHCPKRAWRLHFRGDYGFTKLEFPLFQDEGTDEFDTVDLRTSMNYSWSFKTSNGAENTMNRDVFSRDVQREMGRPYTRSRYYHVFINGVYWGLYQSQERAEASFAETYLGGDKDDYDVIKVRGEDPTARVIEATDGDTDAWREVYDRCLEGFATDEAFQALQGNTPDGVRDPEQPVLVDVDNLVDYMLVIFWTGNFDAPTGAFTTNKEPNNFYAIRSRVDTEQGFTFYAHDSEHSLLYQSWSPGVGVTENRVNLADRRDGYDMDVTDFVYFHPQWLHHRLTENADYRTRFAARAAEVLQGDGPLTGEVSAALFQSRADEIDLAIVAESARWGDAKTINLGGGRTWRTRDEDWVPAIERVTDQWCPARTAIVMEQLTEAGLWAD